MIEEPVKPKLPNFLRVGFPLSRIFPITQIYRYVDSFNFFSH